MIKTGGIFLINKKNELLIAHPTNHHKDFWSITKGKREKYEDSLTCALRETYEECNVDLRGLELKIHKLPKQDFTNKKKSLKAYVVLESENNIDFSKFEFECNTYFEDETGKLIPEMDDWRWLDVTKCRQYVHETQKTCIDIIVNTIIS